MISEMLVQSEKRFVKGPFKPLVIIHGGAGSITRPNLPPSLYDQYHASLKTYLQSTYAVLNGDDSFNQPSELSRSHNEKHRIDTYHAYNAVEAAAHAVSLLEDDPLFNCGHGSVFNTEGEVQMEASIAVSSIHSKIPTSLPGHVKKSAAVSMITQTRHPILLAKEILSMGDGDHPSTSDNEKILGNVRSMHGHLSGEWVEQYGWSKGLEKKPKQWFWTRKRWDEHRRGLGLDHSDEAWKAKLEGDHSELSMHRNTSVSINDTAFSRDNYSHEQGSTHDLPSQGTVGAVCLDTWGNLAVATSTGGLTNKRPGRVGDTPTVGAGFWAESWDETANIDLVNTSRPSHATPSDLETRIPPIQRLLNLTQRDALSWLDDCLPISNLIPPSYLLQSQTQSYQHPCSYHQIPPLCHQHHHHHHHHPNPSSLPIKTQPTPLQSLHPPPISSQSHPTPTHRKAIALSGTGNGDSFLRTSAARTVGSISRFSSTQSSSSSSLANSITLVSGPNGLLQKSAEDRWSTPSGAGEGEGGIIGIEVLYEPSLLPPSSKYLSVSESIHDKSHNKCNCSSTDERLRCQNEHEYEHYCGSGRYGEIQAKVAFDFNCGGMWRAYREETNDNDDGKGGRGCGYRDVVMVFREEYY